MHGSLAVNRKFRFVCLYRKIHQSILSPTATRLQIDSIHLFGTSEHLDLKI